MSRPPTCVAARLSLLMDRGHSKGFHDQGFYLLSVFAPNRARRPVWTGDHGPRGDGRATISLMMSPNTNRRSTISSPAAAT